MNNKSLVRPGGRSVTEAKAEQLLALVESGMSAGEAAASLGTTMSALRNKGGLSALTRRLLDNIAEADLLNETHQRALARGRLVELAMQDDDLKTAVSAARALSGADTPVNATQVNVTNYTPEIVAALKSLKLLPEEEKEKEHGTDGDV